MAHDHLSANKPQCCQAGQANIEWKPARPEYGPEGAGWAIVSGADNDGVHFFCNITFCPWCGRKLPEQPGGVTLGPRWYVFDWQSGQWIPEQA